MRFLRSLKYEFKSMIAQPEFLVVVFFGVAVAVLAHIPPDGFDGGAYKEYGCSPEMGSLLYQNVYGRLLYQFLCPIMASIPAACSYFKEKKRGADALIVPAVGRRNYICAKTLMTFLSGFIVSTLPFLLNLFYSELIYPRNEMMIVIDTDIYAGMPQFAGEWNVFGHLMFTHPVLNHLLHISLVGLWSAGAALLSLGISFFSRRHYLINLLYGTAILLLTAIVLKAAAPACCPYEAFPLLPERLTNYVRHLYFHDPNAEIYHDFADPSGAGLAVVYALLYGACAALTAIHAKKYRDVI